jgi:hypothetical protein
VQLAQTVTGKFLTRTNGDKSAIPILVPGSAGDYDGMANFDSAKPFTLRVKILSPRCVEEGSELNRRVRRAMGRKWDLFAAAMQLRDAHEQGQDFEVDGAFRKLVAAMLPDEQADKATMARHIAEFWAEPGWSKKTVLVNLPVHVSAEMTGARFVLWWNRRRKRFTPAFYCEDYSSAVFTMAVLDYVRACAATGCNRVFVPTKHDQIYHDAKCRNRHRTRRHRDQTKMKSA